MTNNLAIHREGPAAIAALEAWLEGSLPVDDAEKLRAWVAEAGPWRDAYLQVLRDLAGEEALVPRLDAERSISVAMGDAELTHAELIDLLPLPHLGPLAHREGRLTAQGTLWRVVGPGEHVAVAETNLPCGTERLIWDDPVLGTLETPLREFVPDAPRAAHDAFVSVSRLADGLEHPRANAVARAIAEDLGQGSLYRGLVAARTAFVDAKLDDDEEQVWVVCALDTQLALGRLADRLCDTELDERLHAADQALAPLGEALMLLDDRRYAELVHGHAVDEGAWWGFRARLDARVPDAQLESSLDDARDQHVEYSNVLQLSERRSNADDRAATTPRLRAVAAASQPGTVSILVSLDAPGHAEHGQGRVLRATITRGGSGEPFKDCPWFGPVAKVAIRDAYQAVAELCRDGAAPYPLEEHTVLLDNPGELEMVDGSSLGLPLALAFASLWTDTPVSAELCATGRLHSSGGPWFVRPVDHMPAKAAAAREALGADAAVLIAAEHEAHVRDTGLTPRAVESVAEALDAAHLDLGPVEGAWPDNATKAEALKTLIAATHSQDVERFAAFGNPWVVVGRRMQALAEKLTSSKYAPLVDQARPQIVLAYVHAGELGAANRALGDINLEGKPAAVQLAARTARLNAAIDAQNWDLCVVQSKPLDGLLADIAEGEHSDLVGQALGTMGRAHLHGREFQAAEDLLTRAARHHDQHRCEESGRSRVYLAQAQRNLGRTGDALVTLEHAQRDLETHTRPDSGPYFRSCWMYLQHERARVLVARDAGETALPCAREALASSRHLGFWPQLGILRTTAWAHRLLGEHDLADICVEEMSGLDVHGQDELRHRLVEEAEGFPHPGGEVY